MSDEQKVDEANAEADAAVNDEAANAEGEAETPADAPEAPPAA